MGLNVSRGNMYEFVTHTWNTVKGKCPHGCSYCYMKRWGEQKPVRFDKRELNTDLGDGNFIFVGSSCDMWSKDIPLDWILDTLNHCVEYDNKYLFQSKEPQVMSQFLTPANLRGIIDCVVCTTIETNRQYPEVMMNSPSVEHRANYLSHMIDIPRYVTIEPIMDFDLEPMVELIKRCEPEQVNIGADSGNSNLPEPGYDKVLLLIDELKKFTTISKKKNLARLEQK